MSKEKGFTLIELIITLAILSFGIIGVYSAFAPIVALSYTISSRMTAAYLAQEGFEIVRNVRDSNVLKIHQGQRILWDNGLAHCALGCQADYKTGTSQQTFENALKLYNESDHLRIDADGFYSYDQGAATIFTRKITITSAGDGLKVVVEVFWNYNGKPFSFSTEGYLYNYK